MPRNSCSPGAQEKALSPPGMPGPCCGPDALPSGQLTEPSPPGLLATSVHSEETDAQSTGNMHKVITHEQANWHGAQHAGPGLAPCTHLAFSGLARLLAPRGQGPQLRLLRIKPTDTNPHPPASQPWRPLAQPSPFGSKSVA